MAVSTIAIAIAICASEPKIHFRLISNFLTSALFVSTCGMFSVTEVIVEDSAGKPKAPKQRLLKKRIRCYMDIAVDGDSAGRLVFELRADMKPRTCENFRSLCTGEHGISYKDCKFHKIVPGFVLQTGDVELKGQKKEGKGGRSIYGRSFADEKLDKLSHDGYGVLSMANAGPHTNNSQFMIVIDPKGTDWCTFL